MPLIPGFLKWRQEYGLTFDIGKWMDEVRLAFSSLEASLPRRLEAYATVVASGLNIAPFSN